MKNASKQAEQELTKDVLHGRFHWQKQGVAVVMGLLLGLLQVTGIAGFVVAGVVMLYANSFFFKQGGIDDVMSVQDALMSGAQGGFMSFMLIWTVSYTIVHG